MDRKSKILSTVIALAILVSVGITAHRTLIKKDFEILEVEEEVVTGTEGEVVEDEMIEEGVSEII